MTETKRVVRYPGSSFKVYSYLREHPGVPFTVEELATLTGIPNRTVQSACNTLCGPGSKTAMVGVQRVRRATYCYGDPAPVYGSPASPDSALSGPQTASEAPAGVHPLDSITVPLAPKPPEAHQDGLCLMKRVVELKEGGWLVRDDETGQLYKLVEVDL